MAAEIQCFGRLHILQKYFTDLKSLLLFSSNINKICSLPRGDQTLSYGCIRLKRWVYNLLLQVFVLLHRESRTSEPGRSMSHAVHLLLEKETLLTRRHTSEVCFSYQRWLSSQYLQDKMTAWSADLELLLQSQLAMSGNFSFQQTEIRLVLSHMSEQFQNEKYTF